MVIWPAIIYFSIQIVSVKKFNYLLIFVLTEQPNGQCTSVLCKMWPEAEEIFEYQAHSTI